MDTKNIINNISITTMQPHDLSSIKDILISDFDDFWNYNILKEELSSKFSTYLVAKSNSLIIGFAGIKTVDTTSDIMNIVVRKDFRGNHIGNLLLESLIALAKTFKSTSINLEVSSLNTVAISLYQKYDFITIHRRENYYSDFSDAIIMSKKID